MLSFSQCTSTYVATLNIRTIRLSPEPPHAPPSLVLGRNAHAPLLQVEGLEAACERVLQPGRESTGGVAPYAVVGEVERVDPLALVVVEAWGWCVYEGLYGNVWELYEGVWRVM